jgi:hypothetical protein
MRNLARSIAIFHKIASSASLEATAAIIANPARSTVMFTIVCIFRGDGAHDLLCVVFYFYDLNIYDVFSISSGIYSSSSPSYRRRYVII